MADADTIEIRDNPDEGRYELYANGELASFAEYRVVGERVVFPHTVTYDHFRGRGYAGQMIEVALDAVAASGRKVVPACPFVARFIEENPAYQPLVAPHRT
jgi:predicted GNAT family acetyltransferase